MKKILISFTFLFTFFSLTQEAFPEGNMSACTFGDGYDDNLQAACEKACAEKGLKKNGQWECGWWKSEFKNCPADPQGQRSCICGCCKADATPCGGQCCSFNQLCKDGKCQAPDAPALKAACQECKGQDYKECLEGKGFNARIWAFNKFLDGRPDVCPHVQ
ncbi:MAG: hypothetical protein H0X26_09170 [Alphaproteobacteria bacterium]|nr:hypothetical protein [Alphaproteobacteria bacterium]